LYARVKKGRREGRRGGRTYRINNVFDNDHIYTFQLVKITATHVHRYRFFEGGREGGREGGKEASRRDVPYR
jgi:hypothetical protein